MYKTLPCCVKSNIVNKEDDKYQVDRKTGMAISHFNVAKLNGILELSNWLHVISVLYSHFIITGFY